MGKNQLRSLGEREWDAFVGQHPDGHPEQSSCFGRTRRSHGFDCERVEIRDGGRIVGGAQVLCRRTPIGKLALVLRAPLARHDDPRTLKRVVRALSRHARMRSYASVRVELFPTQSAARMQLESAGFRPSAAWAELGERPSLVVPLSLSQETILAKMKARGRYNIKLAERSGVMAEVGGRSSLNEFYDLYRSTAAFQNFPTYSLDYFDEIIRIFGATGKVQIFIARHRSTAIAAIMNTIVGSRCYYTWGGMSRDPVHRSLCANYLLQYFAMAWARAHGCTYYDLSGTSEFKERLAIEATTWSLPLRRCYGAFRDVRDEAIKKSWRSSWVRQGIQACAWKLGVMKRMPY